MTIIALTLIITFTAAKLLVLTKRHNPQLSQALIEDAYESDIKFDFEQNNFRIAVAAVEN